MVGTGSGVAVGGRAMGEGGLAVGDRIGTRVGDAAVAGVVESGDAVGSAAVSEQAPATRATIKGTTK